jgi:hypothetical protein
MSEAQKPVSQALSFADVLNLFRSNIAKFQAELTKMREQIEAAKRRREELQVLQLPDDECADFGAQVLARRAADYEKRLLARLSCVTERPLQDATSPGLQMSMLLLGGQGPVSGQELEAALAYFLHPDQVSAGLKRALAAGVAKRGPGRAEREAELAKLDAQIAQLETKEKAMLAELETIKRKATD